MPPKGTPGPWLTSTISGVGSVKTAASPANSRVALLPARRRLRIFGRDDFRALDAFMGVERLTDAVFIWFGSAVESVQVQDPEHRDPLLTQGIVNDLADIVDDHGGAILRGEHRPARQFRRVGVPGSRERDPGIADLGLYIR